MKFGLAVGVLPMLREHKSPLEELKLPMGELEPLDERFHFVDNRGFFFSEKKKEMQECKRNEE